MKISSDALKEYEAKFEPPFTFPDVQDEDTIQNIRTILFSSFPEVTQDTIKDLPKNKIKKLSLIADRIEFILQLTHFSDIVRKNTTITYNQEIVNDNYDVIKIHKCEVFGIDFSGAEYDIEAVSIYLYLSCIEILSNREEKNPFEFMQDKFKTCNTITYDMIEQCKQEYSEMYGLRKGFINSFVHKLSEHVKMIWLNNFIVCKISKNNDNISEINYASLKTWEEKSAEKKIKEIADHLYTLRSKYTHTASRSFLLTMPVKNSTINFNRKTLIATTHMDLIAALQHTIIDLALIFLRMNEN